MSTPSPPTVAEVHEYSVLQRMRCCGCVSVEKGRKRIARTLMVLGGLGLVLCIVQVVSGEGDIGGQLVLSGFTFCAGLFTYKGYKRNNQKLMRRGVRCMGCVGGAHLVLAAMMFVAGVVIAGFHFNCEDWESEGTHHHSHHDDDDDHREWCEHRTEIGAGLILGSLLMFGASKMYMHFTRVSRAAARKQQLEAKGVHNIANAAWAPTLAAAVAGTPVPAVPVTPSQALLPNMPASTVQAVELVRVEPSQQAGAARVTPGTSTTPALRCSVCRNEVSGAPNSVVNCRSCGALVNLGNSTVMPSPPGVVVGQAVDLGGGQSYVALTDGDVKTV